MPSLLDELKKGPTNNATGQVCRTCTWVDGLTDEDREAFKQATTSGAWPISQLYRLAKGHGLPVGESGFRHHVKEHQTSTD